MTNPTRTIPTVLAHVLLVATLLFLPHRADSAGGERNAEKSMAVESSAPADVGPGCAIQADGTVRCRETVGPKSAQAWSNGRFVAISNGTHHACAIRSDGAVRCWGSNEAGQTDAPAKLQAVAIWAGNKRSCAIAANGGKHCWGDQQEQYLKAFSWAQGSRFDVSSNHAAIAVGDSHSCTLNASALPICWGNDGFHQRSAPAQPMRTLDARGDRTCGIRFDGTIACWGDTGRKQSPPPSGTFRAIDVGQFNACAIRTDGRAVCWGWNANGQNNAPTGKFRRVATGLNHSCGLRDDGTLVCWGYNADGQTNAPAGTFSDIDIGDRHSCGLRTNGIVTCWGLGSEGQTAMPSPSKTYRAIALGAYHSCALGNDGSADCWGRNDAGQAHALSGRFGALAAGFAHTCAIREDGSHACWGDNSFKQASDIPQKALDAPLATDTTPPVITPVITGTLGDNGWYVSDVSLHWVVTDPESPVHIAGGCADVTIDFDTLPEGLGYSCWAYNDTSGPAYPTSMGVNLKRDAHPPIVQINNGLGPNENGWFTQDVGILFSCIDGSSGVESSCSASYQITTEGITPLTHVARDHAGNVVTTNYTVKLDKTPPTVSAVLPVGQVVIGTNFDTQLTASDATSGVNWSKTACTPIATRITDWEAVCTAVDNAGNSARKQSGYSTVYAFEGFLAPFDNPNVLYEVEVDRNLPIVWWARDAKGNPVLDPTFGWYEVGKIPCPNLPIVRVDWRGQFQQTGERVQPNGSHRLDMHAYPEEANYCLQETMKLRDQSGHTLYFKVRPRTMHTGGPQLPQVSTSPRPSASLPASRVERTNRMRTLRGHRSVH